MRQIGHRSAALTLEVYTDITDRKHEGNARLAALLFDSPSDLAPVDPSDAC